MRDTLLISDLLGYASICCWLGAQFPQVVENIQRQSCEGLALPFLANWLLGDISNLVGCVLTHQLPFQTYLASYFVCVDFMLVAQYFYYYKPPAGPTSVLGHIRSATAPAAVRRMSIDRGVGRYRTLSTLASNVAAAAAIAAKQDEQSDLRRARYSHAPSRIHGYEESNTSRASRRNAEDEEEEDIPTMMADSFHSEGGRDIGRKRVSWSIERHGGRAASVGRPAPLTLSTTHHFSAADSPLQSTRDVTFPRLDSSITESPVAESNESITPISSTRGSRAGRRGSTIVFLGAWALFGIGTLAGRQNIPVIKSVHSGHVVGWSEPTSFMSALDLLQSGQLYHRDTISETPLSIVDLPPVKYVSHEPSEDPSPEQVLGRIFAWLCTTLYLTSRLPQIWKNYVRKSVEGLSMYLFIFAFLGNTFYVASILTSPRRFLPEPESSAFIRESVPYLLGSAGTLMFDVTIVGQSLIYRPKHKRHGMRHGTLTDEEQRGLLSGEPVSGHESGITHRGRAARSDD